MKHLKPYNKIYSMMYVVVFCVWACVVFSCRIKCISYVFKRCLKICSHIYHVFCIFHTFFVFFFSDRYVFLMSKILLCTFGPRDSIRQ